MPPRVLRVLEDGFLDEARLRLGTAGLVSGEDGDFAFVVCDARRFALSVLDARGTATLERAVKRLARTPEVVVNAQFMTGSPMHPVEGEVMHGGRLLERDSRSQRAFVADTGGRSSVASSIRIGPGDPSRERPRVSEALGGLGPLLFHRQKAPVTDWTRSILKREAAAGRGIIALDDARSLFFILVQRNRLGATAQNAAAMPELRDWLLRMKVSHAVFNDGSDSEALAVRGEWLVEPALLKSAHMSYALAVVDRKSVRPVRVLALDGTTTSDAAAFVSGLEDARSLTFPVENLAPRAAATEGFKGVSAIEQDGVVQMWRAASGAGERAARAVARSGGTGAVAADLLYLSGHATRSGQLIYHGGGGLKGRSYVVASPWSSALRPEWKHSRWVVLAGCAVLSLRYSRLVALDASERAAMLDRHRQIHGERAAIADLEDRELAWQVYHPGWGWYHRVLKDGGVRGVLGYWYRSPGTDVGDVDIIEELAERLRDGEGFLDAWRRANTKLLGSIAWAAMIRDGCEDDTLATLEQERLPAARGGFLYHDAHQDGVRIATAFERANRLDTTSRVSELTLRTNALYDRVTLDKDPKKLSRKATPANTLLYDDGIRP